MFRVGKLICITAVPDRPFSSRFFPFIAPPTLSLSHSRSTWTFIQFISAIYEGSEPDKRLVEVSWSLRQAVSGDWDWRDLFAGLRPPSGSLSIYRQHLAWEAAALVGKLELASNEGPGVKAHIKLLRTLRSSCESEPIRADRAELLTAKGAFPQYARLFSSRQHPWGTSAQSTAPTVFSSGEILAEDPQPITGRSIDQDGGEGTECWEAKIDERLNPVAQEHEARGVLLATIEDQQFLPFSTNHARSLLSMPRLNSAAHAPDLQSGGGHAAPKCPSA